MNIVIDRNGLYFAGKVGELRLLLSRLAGTRLSFADFLRQNLQ